LTLKVKVKEKRKSRGRRRRRGGRRIRSSRRKRRRRRRSRRSRRRRPTLPLARLLSWTFSCFSFAEFKFSALINGPKGASPALTLERERGCERARE
jgi:hypothetical protein